MTRPGNRLHPPPVAESPSPAPVIPDLLQTAAVPMPHPPRQRRRESATGSRGQGHPAAGRRGKDVPSRHRGPRTHLDPDHGRPEPRLPGPPQAGRQNRADGLRLFPARHRQCGGNQSHLPGEAPGKPGKAGTDHPHASAGKGIGAKIALKKFPFDNARPIV